MSAGTVLIVGGGTGGHLSPGIALYEEFKARGVSVHFLCSESDTRFSSMKDVRKDDLLLYAAPPLTRNILKLPLFALRFAASVFKASRIIGKMNAGAVIGMGGYVSAPALIAAVFRGAPIYLCEQNTVPGRVTSFFTRYAARVFTTFKATEEYVKNQHRSKLSVAGNPIRKKVMVKASREEAKRHFNMKHCRRVVLAIGGSQGALTINELVLGLRKRFPGEFDDTGIIWSTGDYSYGRYGEAMRETADAGSIYISPFIENVGLAYRASDVAISRSGSGVMMELAAMGVPSVLIPFPYAAMNHQDKNADVFAESGAAIKISNEDAVPEKVGPVLSELLQNPTQLRKMSARALESALPDAARVIVDAVKGDMSAKKLQERHVQKV